MLVKSLAVQVAKDGITINNVAPGVIDTDRNIEALSDPVYAQKVRDLIPVGFYGEKEQVAIDESAGRICSEFVMCYPPGIPILAPGEEITADIIEYIKYAKEKGSFLTGPEDMEVRKLNVLKGGC